MKNENEKMSLFQRLTGMKKNRKSSCCSIELEEVKEENPEKNGSEESPASNDRPCCN